MAKTSLQAITAVIAERYGLKSAEATAFVNAFFEQIQAGLEQDRLVKVRGLGTFKVQAVKSRESVNVNTGERVVIGGHEKMAFTPDNAMKELVNRPFADFETVVIKDGVDVDSIPTPTEENTGEPEDAGSKDDIVPVEIAPSPIVEPAERAGLLHDLDKKEIEQQSDDDQKVVGSQPQQEEKPVDLQEKHSEDEQARTQNVSQEPQEVVPQIEDAGSQPPAETAEKPADNAQQGTEQEDRPVVETPKSQPQNDAKPSRKLSPSERFSQLMDGDADENPVEDLSASEEDSPSPETIEANGLIKGGQSVDKEEVALDDKTDSLTLQSTDYADKTVTVSTPDGDSSASETADDAKPKSRKTCTVLLIVVSILALAGLGVGGYLYYISQQEPSQQPAVEKLNKPKSVGTKPAPVTDAAPKAEQNAAAKTSTSATSHNEDDAEAKKNVTPGGIDLEKANRYPALRYGAYRIVGVEKKVVLRRGDSMEKLCRRTLGKDMMGYFEAINGKGLHGVGDTILVPKVELRPEYRN